MKQEILVFLNLFVCWRPNTNFRQTRKFHRICLLFCSFSVRQKLFLPLSRVYWLAACSKICLRNWLLDERTPFLILLSTKIAGIMNNRKQIQQGAIVGLYGPTHNGFCEVLINIVTGNIWSSEVTSIPAQLGWYKSHKGASSCPPWLEKVSSISSLKWLKLHSNCPPWVEIFTHIKRLFAHHYRRNIHG